MPAGGSAANPALPTRARLPGGVCGSPGCARQLGMRKENVSAALRMSNSSLGWCSHASWDRILTPVQHLRGWVLRLVGGHAPLPLRGEGRGRYKRGTKPAGWSRGAVALAGVLQGWVLCTRMPFARAAVHGAGPCCGRAAASRVSPQGLEEPSGSEGGRRQRCEQLAKALVAAVPAPSRYCRPPTSRGAAQPGGSLPQLGGSPGVSSSWSSPASAPAACGALSSNCSPLTGFSVSSPAGPAAESGWRGAELLGGLLL